MNIYWSNRFDDYFFELNSMKGFFFCCVYDLALNECGWSLLNCQGSLEFVCDVENDK